MPRTKGSRNNSTYKYVVYDKNSGESSYFIRQRDIATAHNITYALVQRRLFTPDIPHRVALHLTIKRLDTYLPVYRTVLTEAVVPSPN